MFWPSTKPNARSPCRNDSIRGDTGGASPGHRRPILVVLPACCARRERARDCCAAEQRDELAALHSITSSAPWRTIKRADRIRDTRQLIHSMISSATDRNESGMVRPIVLAALRLTINSNRIGTSTGRSAGLAPLKILSISLADCLYTLGRFAP
jgi:hypothetical protein